MPGRDCDRGYQQSAAHGRRRESRVETTGSLTSSRRLMSGRQEGGVLVGSYGERQLSYLLVSYR